MSERKTERLLNLVIALLATRRFLSVEQIRTAVPQYAESSSEEAFRRMFERDKEELRELGVPLETGSHSAFDDEVGYRIPRREYELPELTLEADEAAAVGLAARMWQSAALARPAAQAWTKLRVDLGAEPDSAPVLEPRIETPDPAFEPLLDAVRDRQVVRFTYRGLGAVAAGEREVEPWGVVSWRGRWYLAGFDRARADTRVFRLSRIEGQVRPTGAPGAVVAPATDLVELVAAVAREAPESLARVRVRAGRAADLRREARPVAGAGEWDTVEVGYADLDRLAERVAGYGPDAVALDPPELRTAVVARLRAAAGAA